MSATDHLVRLALDDLGPGPTDLPTDLMQLCLLDWAACAMAAREEPVTKALLSKADCPGRSDVFGSDPQNAAMAALVNGTMGHALDYDDTHFDHIGHTSAVIMPAVLAVALEQRQTDMAQVLEAALVGSEAAVRTGLWLGRDHYQVGFHQTATAGAFGATIAISRLLSLKPAQIRHAIGLTATMASGLKGQFGTMGKPLNAGLAARAAVEATTWAQAGMTSDPQGLLSFAKTHHGQCNEAAWDTTEPWKIARISHKFHACCHGLHATLEALGTLSFDPSQLDRLALYTHPRWMTVCNQIEPETGLGVKFSYRHTAAMAMMSVPTMAIQSYTDAIAQDPALVALRQKVEVHPDDTLSEMQSYVVASLRDGSEQTARFDLDAPLGITARQTRLRSKAEALLGADRAARLWAVPDSGNAAGLFRV